MQETIASMLTLKVNKKITGMMGTKVKGINKSKKKKSTNKKITK